jgi:transcription-repair coupling factor (superfamily II helicase)
MPPDTDLLHQFEAAFVYEESPDQLEAIATIKEDLQRERPMDRLLCGDVGYGKTEVAMRAAFKAVDGGYQVAVLAPTTILADQHLETFRKRFAGFPVTVEMVSRFRSPQEVRELKVRLAEGKVDVLIGTHRLLSKDIQLPRLGLLIVDEEQRFGVAQKERLKQLKKRRRAGSRGDRDAAQGPHGGGDGDPPLQRRAGARGDRGRDRARRTGVLRL